MASPDTYSIYPRRASLGPVSRHKYFTSITGKTMFTPYSGRAGDYGLRSDFIPAGEPRQSEGYSGKLICQIFLK